MTTTDHYSQTNFIKPDVARYRIMLVAGEPSGDALGGQLMMALNQMADRPIDFIGVGGEAMTAQGLDSLYPIDDLAVMGLREIVPRLPILLNRIRRAVDHGIESTPHLAILIDSGDFNYRVARGLKRKGFKAPVVKFVSPQIWASRPNRVFGLAKVFDHVLALLPFEPKFYDRVNLPTTFVGHPVTERGTARGQGPAFRERHNIPGDAKLLCVLPGSRINEIHYLMPVFGETVKRLAQSFPDLHIVVPTVPNVAAEVKRAVTQWPKACVVTEGESAKFAAFDASDAALAASGTVALELALAGVPTVIGYKVGWLTAAIARRFITVPYGTLTNLLLEREVVPEFVQERCTPEALQASVTTLLTDPNARTTQINQLKEAVEMLRIKGQRPSERAAETVLTLMRNHIAAA